MIQQFKSTENFEEVSNSKSSEKVHSDGLLSHAHSPLYTPGLASPYEQELFELTAKLNSKIQKIEELQNIIRKQEMNYDMLREKHEKLEEVRMFYQSRERAYRSDIERAQEILLKEKKLEGELLYHRKLLSKFERYRYRIKTVVRSQLIELKKQILHFTRSAEEMSRKALLEQNNRKALEEEVKNLKKHITQKEDELRLALLQGQEEKIHLGSELKTVLQSRLAYEEHLAQSKAEIDRLLKNQASSLENWEKTKRELELVLSQKETEITRLQDEKNRLDGFADQLKEEKKTLEKNLHITLEEVSKKDFQHQELQTRVNDLERQVYITRLEWKKLLDENEKLQKQVSALEELNQRLTSKFHGA